VHYIGTYIEETDGTPTPDERENKNKKGYLYSRMLFLNGDGMDDEYLVVALCIKIRLKRDQKYQITYGKYSNILVSIKNVYGQELLKEPKRKKAR